MNRIKQTFQKKENILSIYFSAGYPNLNDTVSIIQELEKSGVDLIEIGLPFSDPLADGPTIQESGGIALKNGMTTEILFNQLRDIRQTVNIPLILMGYFNPIFQYGVKEFCAKCKDVGIDGLIIPDLPVDIYQSDYQEIFKANNLSNIFLITPQTSEERIRYIDSISDSFLYMVSSASVTGSKEKFNETQLSYFKRVTDLNLNNPRLIGFGVSNYTTFNQTTEHANGAIIGSAFIQFLTNHRIEKIGDFVNEIREI